MQLSEYILLCILFYIIGSIPTAYLLVKYKTGKDITKEGSGNVGALNSFEVSKSRLIGITVLVLDFLKGFLPSFLFLKIAGYSIETMFLPIALIVLGHNFSVWLKFKGGRGLATAAGIIVAVEPVVLLIWCILFLISYVFYRKVHFGNIVATLLVPVFYYLWLSLFFITASNNLNYIFVFITIVCLLILLKHIHPFLDMIKTRKKE